MNRKRRSLISAAPSTGPLEGAAPHDDEPDDDERSDALRTERFTEDEPPSSPVAEADVAGSGAGEPESMVEVPPEPVAPVEATADPPPEANEPDAPEVDTKAPPPSPLPTSFDTPAPGGGVRDEGWFVGTGTPSPERRDQPELDLEPTLHPAKQNVAPMLVVGLGVVGLVLLLVLALSLG